MPVQVDALAGVSASVADASEALGNERVGPLRRRMTVPVGSATVASHPNPVSSGGEKTHCTSAVRWQAGSSDRVRRSSTVTAHGMVMPAAAECRPSEMLRPTACAAGLLALVVAHRHTAGLSSLPSSATRPVTTVAVALEVADVTRNP